MSGPPTFPPNRSRRVKAVALAVEDFSVGYLRNQLATYRVAFYDASDAAEKIRPYHASFDTIHHKDRVIAAFKGKSGEAITRRVVAGVQAYLKANPVEQKQYSLRLKVGLEGFGIERRALLGTAVQRAALANDHYKQLTGRARTVWPGGKPPRKLPAPTHPPDQT